MSYNNELRMIDTEEKAYFLGLIYADGCISITSNGHRFQISLIDEDLIKSLYQHFPFLNINIFDFGKYKSSWSKQYSLRKTSRELVNDLKLHGVVERKSGKGSAELIVPALSNDLINHFIRGFFDGDGSINIPKRRPNLRRVEICCSSKSLLLQIKSILENNGISCPIFRKRVENRINPLYILEWVNFRDITDLKNFLYKNSTLHLSRKKELFDSFIKVDKKKDNPKCVYCLSECCEKQGARQMKKHIAYRYHCKECDKRFSILAQVKQGELLETPVVKQENQQPSLSSNVLEGSTTNSQVPPSNIEDSNADTSALQQTINIKSRGLTIYPGGVVSGGLKSVDDIV